jgi:hypothetical protein
MIELVALSATALVLWGVSAWRLLTLRFPHPADIATMSVFFYSLPLIFAAIFLGKDVGSVFLHSAASDYGLAMEGLWYSTLAGACLLLGRRLASSLRGPHVRLCFPLAASDITKVHLIIPLVISVIALGIVLYGPDAYFSGYNVESAESSAQLGNGLIYLSIEWLGLLIGYGIIVSRATSRRPGWPFLLAIGVVLFLGAVRGKRLEVISALLPVAVLVFANQRFFRTIGGRVCAIGAAAILVSAMASLRYGESPSIFSMLFNLVSEGLYAGHSLPGILEKLHSGQVEYEYGARVIGGFLAFVPRFLWPDKDELLYEGNQALEGVNPLGATNILAEVVLQGGGIAVVLWFTILGFAFERVHRSMGRFDAAVRARRLPAVWLSYLVIVTSFIPHFRDGIISAVKIALQSVVFLYVVAGLRFIPSLAWRGVLRRQARSPTGVANLPVATPPGL